MKKEKSKILPIILGLSSLIALVLFVFLPIGSSTFGSITGYNSIFGITQNISNLKLYFNGVNGVGLTMFIFFILSALLSGLLGYYKRSLYIVSCLIEVILIIFLFTYHSTWAVKTIPPVGYFDHLEIGVGPIISAIIMIIHALADLVAFKLAKK